MSKNKEIMKPITYAPLSQISNPLSLVQEPGDRFSYEMTDNGNLVVKLHAGGVKRSAVKYRNGTVVEHTSNKYHARHKKSD